MSESWTIGAVLYPLLLVVLFAIGAWAGWVSAYQRLRERDKAVRMQEDELQAGWDALHRTQRVNAAFWQARQALRDEPCGIAGGPASSE